MPANLAIDRNPLRIFCRKWAVTQVALSGSVLRGDLGPDSDADVMLSFASAACPSLLDLSDEVQREMCAVFGRKVDVTTRRGVEEFHHPFRRSELLAAAEVIDAA